MKPKARMMFEKYPELFMAMYLHSLEVDEEHPDDNSVIYSKIMANIANPGTYWMPEGSEKVLEDFAEEV